MARWLTDLLRALKWGVYCVLLVLFPIYVQSFIDGYFLTQFRDGVHAESIARYENNTRWPSPYSTGGFRLVLPLSDPTTWWEMLGLRRFDLTPGDPVDRYAHLHGLFRRRREGAIKDGKGVKVPWQHWVYISPREDLARALREGGPFEDPWDAAFDELLRERCRTHPPRDLKRPVEDDFHYLHCPGSFLCGLWLTRGPALLHLTTDEADLWPEMDLRLDEERQAEGYSDPVAVRLIELPIADPVLPMRPGTFPSQLEQLRSLTRSEHTWQLFPTYTTLQQLQLRLFEEITPAKQMEHPWTYGLLARFNEWNWEMAGSQELEPIVGLTSLAGLMTYLAGQTAFEVGLDYWKDLTGTREACKACVEDEEDWGWS